ncbi:hypothetical protein DICPUDRAFT_160210 [Dictyostelium purpureum]|uniref:Oxysterol binding family protein n=1 Tax=Dictyostelium purpureum TaxID=5786 RepID=F1A5X8_DICPU|nr:uncharacterized protein DICPUDRAFT_160210 [Dictyostelium purpureum]EGC28403.1 hypothetical protein DICPUDRAFT_160210 [Dictyostelium purpureum]|eukprot:XP_003295072.1 hypothetical protein DICPUDRAFT_160210 [Dictyostelium purpureum]
MSTKVDVIREPSLTEDSVSDLSSDGIEAEGVDNTENHQVNGADDTVEEATSEAGIMKQAFSFVKNHLKVGADMTKLPIPATFTTPISFLTAIQTQSAIFSHLLTSAPYIKDDEQRFLQVLKYHLTWPKMYFPKNPLNPILGEIYECSVNHIDEKTSQVIEGDTTNFFAEQVSHHPPISCFHFWNDKHGFKYDAKEQITPVFKGKCIRVNMDVKTCITLENKHTKAKETYVNDKFPEGYLRLLRWKFEFSGKYTFSCPETGYTATINFKDKPIIGGKWHDIQVIVSKNNENLYDIHGTHVDVLTITNLKNKTSEVFMNYTILRTEPTIEEPFEQLKDNTSQKVWKGVADGFAKKDSRKAGVEKQRIEEAQRKKAKANLAKDPNFVHKPAFFIPNPESSDGVKPEYIYKRSEVKENNVVAPTSN